MDGLEFGLWRLNSGSSGAAVGALLQLDVKLLNPLLENGNIDRYLN